MILTELLNEINMVNSGRQKVSQIEKKKCSEKKYLKIEVKEEKRNKDKKI